MSWPARVLILFSICLLTDAARSGEDRPSDETRLSDAAARKRLAVFKKEFATVDLDLQLDAVQKLGRGDHPTIGKRLLRLLKHRDPEIRIEAMEGLGNQAAMRKTLPRRLSPWLDERKRGPRLAARTVETIGRLDLRSLEGELLEKISSKEDAAAIAAIRVLGQWKCRRALRPILGIWKFYPTDGSFQTGSVTLPNGTPAKARKLWMRKFGGIPRRARPELVHAIIRVVNEIAGIEDEARRIRHPDDLRKWMSENRAVLRQRR